MAEERKKVWMCGVCGKVGKTRDTIGDESCYLHGVEVWEDSIRRGDDGVSAVAVPR